jgi:S-adenosylmethionine/arginine decarboxylase-like enzyme
MTAIAQAPAPTTAALAPWGMMAVIDLHDADHDRLADPDNIREFVADVVDAIGMVAHGPTLLERFGEGDLEGWSAMQFIETSSLTIHADEYGGRCYVDVFSCKSFDPEVAAEIAVRYFGGWPKLTVLHR